jgi:excisionase family DNA binding protein
MALKRISEVAREIGLSVKTLRSAVQRGDLRAVQLGEAENSPYRVSLDDVKAWLSAREVRRRAW